MLWWWNWVESYWISILFNTCRCHCRIVFSFDYRVFGICVCVIVVKMTFKFSQNGQRIHLKWKRMNEIVWNRILINRFEFAGNWWIWSVFCLSFVQKFDFPNKIAPFNLVQVTKMNKINWNEMWIDWGEVSSKSPLFQIELNW